MREGVVLSWGPGWGASWGASRSGAYAVYQAAGN